MIKDAEAHAAEDRKRKEKIDARNQLDTLIYQVEKDLKDWGDKVSGDAKSRLESALENAKKALKQDDLAELNRARDELMQAFSAAGQQFYQAQAASQAASAEAGSEEPATAKSSGGDDVVEADYEIVEDK